MLCVAGDVFILDMGLTLYQWNGSGANKYEKFKALELSTFVLCRFVSPILLVRF